MRKKKSIQEIPITINKNKSDVELGEDAMIITAENGIRLEIPYEDAAIEAEDKKITFKVDGDDVIVKEKKLKK